MRLVPADLEDAYLYLRGRIPFRGRKLPDPDDLEFRVTRHKDRFGHFDDRDGKSFPNISISEVLVNTYDGLLATMAHEMAHGVLFSEGHPRWYQHGAAFKRLARRVCQAHGFDLKAF